MVADYKVSAAVYNVCSNPLYVNNSSCDCFAAVIHHTKIRCTVATYAMGRVAGAITMNQYFSTTVLAALLRTSSTLLFAEAIANASTR